MKKTMLVVAAALLAGCVTPPPPPAGINPDIKAALDKAAEQKPRPPRSAAIEQALLPPLRMQMPKEGARPGAQRFDLSVNDAPAAQVFMAIVSGTPYSMLVRPEVKGTITVNLKDVTVPEALESISQLYGYDYRIEGTRVLVMPPGLQTRVYKVNYLPGTRRGESDLRVQSGSVSDTSVSGQPPLAASYSTPVPGTLPQSTGVPPSSTLQASRVTTRLVNDFWTELKSALAAIVGSGEGRSVVVSPDSGVILVRAFPADQRAVQAYLHATKLAIERQVMLEAKIIEVTLSDQYQSGINWAAFRNAGPNVVAGQLNNATGTTTLSATGGAGQILSSAGQTVDTTARVAAVAGSAIAASNPASGVFGLALQTSNFAALLQFLQTQGNVQVLSSPRVATLNNQMAVLKVGTDQFFVTNVATVTTVTGSTTQQTPTVTVAPFFSGVMLDVTPQIDDHGDIILHIHPAVSDVSTAQTVVSLGGSVPSITLPLAKSTVSETDTVVRVQDGTIVAIGGLMSVSSSDNRGGVPGVGDNWSFLRNTNRQTQKQELVILLKPTVISSDQTWVREARDARERLEQMTAPQPDPGARQ